MQYELSYWEKESFFKGIDVAIIGSGIVGLSAAIHLKTLEPNSRIVVLERGALPTGASTRNAGFACFGSMTELLDDLSHMSEDDVLGVVEKRWTGLQRLRSLVGDENLDFRQLGQCLADVLQIPRARSPRGNPCQKSLEVIHFLENIPHTVSQSSLGHQFFDGP